MVCVLLFFVVFISTILKDTWGVIWHESILHKAIKDGIYLFILEKEEVFPI